jgi:hypothetical protein
MSVKPVEHLKDVGRGVRALPLPFRPPSPPPSPSSSGRDQTGGAAPRPESLSWQCLLVAASKPTSQPKRAPLTPPFLPPLPPSLRPPPLPPFP